VITVPDITKKTCTFVCPPNAQMKNNHRALIKLFVRKLDKVIQFVELSTETLKNLTKHIYLCFSLYHKISVDDQFSNYHIYNNRKYSEITMMLHLNIESILKINCITPETNSLIHCININLPKTLPSDFFHNFS
jgi:hypothetical protein